jgi:hypothetical protein
MTYANKQRFSRSMYVSSAGVHLAFTSSAKDIVALLPQAAPTATLAVIFRKYLALAQA